MHIKKINDMKMIKFLKDLIGFRHTIAELNLRINKLEFQVNNPPLFKVGDDVDGNTIESITVRYDRVLDVECDDIDFKIKTINKLEYFYLFKQKDVYKGLIPQRKLNKNKMK